MKLTQDIRSTFRVVRGNAWWLVAYELGRAVNRHTLLPLTQRRGNHA